MLPDCGPCLGALRRQTRIFLSVPHLTGHEQEVVERTFRSNWISTCGPNLSALENEFSTRLGLPSAALVNGTAAIHLGLKLLGVQPGDEVVAPTLTFVATCNPILYERAIPILMDSERRSWNLDPNLLESFLKKRARVNRLPRAIVVVHLYGQTADLRSIVDICKQFDVPLLEDAAEALGAQFQGRPAGTFGDIGIFSLNGNKIITCGGGGMLVSQRGDWVERARFWSTQCRDARRRMRHDQVYMDLGYNYRLSNVLAGVGLAQLDALESRVQQRRAVFERYRQGFEDLEGIEAQREVDWSPREANFLPSRHTRWLSCFLIDERKFGMSAAGLIRYLEAANIESRPVWKPMHAHPLFEKFECIGGDVAEDLNQRGICLPSSSSLSESDQECVIETVRRACNR